MGYIFLGLLIYLFIAWLIAQEFQEIAFKKGYSDKKYFWYSFLFGIAGYLMIAALPVRKTEEEPDTENNTVTTEEKAPSGIKQCPSCGVHHDADFNVCPSCKYEY